MQKPKIEKPCAHCGTPFIPKMVTSSYCSKKCSSAAFKRREAEKKREERLDAIAGKNGDIDPQKTEFVDPPNLLSEKV